PFAGVDAQTAQHIARALDDWLQEKTVIYFVHQVDDASLLSGVEYSWRLAEGQLIADTGINN
ncbi:thiol reductant ABC exporter subunit CydC, partial [Streptococcus danieliae]|nr:thiol reductant ABC exporter subunit CydC [Streptococcus danieliae]